MTELKRRYWEGIDWWRKPVREVETVLHLCFWRRVFHHKARRPFLGVCGGVVVMVAGATLVKYGEQVGDWAGLSHVLVDTFGNFVHAAGAVPALRYIEPLWVLLMGAAE